MGKKIFFLALFVLVLSNISFVLADDWPTFGHDAARNSWALSFAPDYDLYSSTGLTGSIALAAGDYVESTPVIKNNVMYVLAGQLDASNHFSTGKLYAFNTATNAKIWEVSFALDQSPKVTPTVSDDGSTICHGGGSVFYCRNASDGTIFWSYADAYAGNFIYSPAISNGRVWATTRGNPPMIYAFNLTDGTVLFSKIDCDGCGDAVYNPVLSAGTLYFAGESTSPCSGGVVMALDENAAAVKWAYTSDVGAISLNTPSVHNDKVFIGVENQCEGISTKGYLLALSKNDGSLLWRAAIPVAGQHFISSMPAVYANKVIIASRDEANTNHYVFAFNESSGAVLWQSANMAYAVGGPVSVADSKVVVSGADSRKINVFSTLNGTLLWSNTASGDVYSAPSIVNGTVYTGTTSTAGTNVVELLKSDTTYEGSVSLSPLKTATIDASANSDAIIQITPKSTLLTTASGTINISEFLQQTTLTLGVTQLNKYINIKADPTITNNMLSATIKIYYTDDEIAAAGIDENSLKLYAVVGNTTVLTANSGVDKVNNFVYGTTTTFSSYGAAGNIKDYDNDGIADFNDNCVSSSNADQADSDQDGIGDACDNCINAANPDQSNADNDTIGNACDTDDDNDGVLDVADNCRIAANSDQADSDADGADGIGDACDNCMDINNTEQADADKDGHGDACDSCSKIYGAYHDAPSSNIKDVIYAIDGSVIAKGTKNSLTSKLDGAVSSLSRNQLSNARRKLDSFISELDRLYKQRKLGSGPESNEETYGALRGCAGIIKGQIR